MKFFKKATLRLSVSTLVLLSVISGITGVAGAVRVGATLGSAAGSRTVTAPSWHKCNKQFLCTFLPVPLSYKTPSLGSIKIAVVESPALSGPGAPDIFINPGGPGLSGVQFLESEYKGFPLSVRKSFNLISWDPRGVGQSDPVTCLTNAQQMRSYLALNPDPSTKKEINADIAGVKNFVSLCRKHTSKVLLENISTANDARDLNLLRMDLGQSKLNYLGFSYGTYLGETYAQMFPHTVRAMTLDGVVNPDITTLQADAAQSMGFENELNGFFKYCDHNSTCSQGLPGGAASQFGQIMKQFKNGSTVVGQLKAQYGGNVIVNYAIALLGTIAALYSPKTWPLLGVGLAAILSTGDGQVLAGLAYGYAGLQLNGKFTNQDAANTAISCVDRPSLGSLSQLEKDARRLDTTYPDFGGSVVWSNLPCLFWPVKSQGSPKVIHAPGAPTILLVGSTGDPATPYQWAKSVKAQLGNAVLLTRVGSGHLGYFASVCVQGYVDNYFANLRLPKANTVCH